MDNPLKFIDPNGMEVEFADENAEKLYYETYNRIVEKIEQLEKQISKAKKEGRKEKLEKKKEKIAEVKQSFDDIYNDKEQMFVISTKPNDGENGQYVSGGGTAYNPETKNVDIWVYDKLDHILVHEVRHGAGYLREEWSWDIENDHIIYYDYQDEFEGFKHEKYYNEIVWDVTDRSYELIKLEIQKRYSTKEHIIKEFKQIKVPK